MLNGHYKLIKSISLNFHTPFEGTEYLALEMEKRQEIIDKLGEKINDMTIAYQLKHYNDI